MTTVKLYGGDLGEEVMMVRCDLGTANAPVEADYCKDEGWIPTQYKCSDAKSSAIGLSQVGKLVCSSTIEIPIEQFKCQWTIV